MTGHERKIFRAERHLKQMQALVEEIPWRVRAGLPEGVTGDNVITHLTNLLNKDIEATRKELEQLKNISTQI